MSVEPTVDITDGRIDGDQPDRRPDRRPSCRRGLGDHIKKERERIAQARDRDPDDHDRESSGRYAGTPARDPPTPSAPFQH